ncbi:MAG: hypothetical protein EOO28_28835 [Comamonadaceae bacterium]|nr:MAG: hypothetical protein EOO28_28835 [Comamonadaceae bacterium]
MKISLIITTAIAIFIWNKTALAASTTRVNYCQTVEFDPGIFDRTTLNHASKHPDCRQRAIPLLFKKSGSSRKAQFFLTPLPSLVTYIEKPKDAKEDYIFNEREFTIALSKWLKAKKIDLSKYTYRHDVRSIQKPQGNVVSSTVSFLDDAMNVRFIIKDISFFKDDRYAASYSSNVIDIKDEQSIEITEAIEKLFLSMEINW